MAVDFSTVLASMRKSGTGTSVIVPADWLQGRTAFGGLQAALAVRAMRDALGTGANAIATAVAASDVRRSGARR